ncbi:MAG TPA: glycosyltransferase family 2 protein [Caulobacterales bacterium]|nr:glycosyltransferase family 2 protein [Caulobacterales bacterium]
MRLCAIIPSYRHASALPKLVEALRPACETVFIVDDGNEEPIRGAIAAAAGPGVNVLRHETNQGKGRAVALGFRAAIASGFTHALQLDADGQHDVADLPKFIAAAREAPRALICGQALYDDSVPRARKFGRYITHFWVWVETFSFDIADSMCGFRLYPLAPVAKLIAGAEVGARMNFDTEIAVRLHWMGVPVVNLPTRVIYPEGNVSNFQMLEDNLRISLMHTQLALQAPFRVLWKLLRAPFSEAGADRRRPSTPGSA